MPKKTRLQKLRNQTKNTASIIEKKAALNEDLFFSIDPVFKKDLLKSVVFAFAITTFEIAIYVVYYLRLFERR